MTLSALSRYVISRQRPRILATAPPPATQNHGDGTVLPASNATFLARDSIHPVCLVRYLLSSVRPSVTRGDQSQTVGVSVIQISPHGSPIPLVNAR